jgi:hypothetical protein
MPQPAGVGNQINRDLGAQARPIASIFSILGNNTTEGTGVAVDLKGYESAMVLFNIGISGDTLSGSVYMTCSVEESDDGSTGWGAIPAAGYRLDVGPSLVVDDPAEDPILIGVTLLAGAGRKRYVRAMITFTGTHTNGTPIGAVVVKGHPRVAPAA